MPQDWSQLEVEAIVADYFAMWEAELREEKYNKAAHNLLLRKILSNRSHGSVEKKHQNISAVLWHLGYPYIDGYKPLPRYQGLLRAIVEDRLVTTTVVNELLAKRVRAKVEAVPPIENLKAIQVPPPNGKDVKTLVREETRQKTKFVKRNYLEAEANNQSLGQAGEKFIFRFEQERLWKAGKRSLADKVEHVAQTKDYLGYDILSFETNGRERLIEVKTTRFGKWTRFFASANELEVSEVHKDIFHLCRLFHFDKEPKFFLLAGSLHNTCQLKPANYWAIPN